MLSAFALLALTLSAVGLYGVLSYMVSQQTRDLGIRLAIGAQRRDIFRLLMSGALRMAAVGAALGFVAALHGTDC